MRLTILMVTILLLSCTNQRPLPQTDLCGICENVVTTQRERTTGSGSLRIAGRTEGDEAPISCIVLTLIHPNGTVDSTCTNKEGRSSFDHLPPGYYSLTATAPKCKKVIADSVEVRSDLINYIDVRIEKKITRIGVSGFNWNSDE